jgi:diguanylate cyclase (GGDEF)-like protein
MSCLVPVLDMLCPMHLILSPKGRVRAIGRTLRKVLHPTTVDDARFLELFEIQRPGGIDTFSDLRAAAGQKIALRLRQRRQTMLQGVAAPMDDGGLALNLSFGISVIDAVRDYGLSAGDFPVTDLTVEMLYLVEAKSLAMEASRHLNMRLRSAMIAAEEQAFTDTLTGLKNRRALDHVLPRALEAGRPVGLLSLDLDLFKAVNDTHGHAAGDAILQHVAQCMLDETRDADTLARVGGDEFIILLPGMRRIEPAIELAKRLITRIEVPLRYGSNDLQVSASIGIVLSNDLDAPDPAQTIEAADRALYEAKREGRGTFAVHEPEAPRPAASPTQHNPRRPARSPARSK